MSTKEDIERLTRVEVKIEHLEETLQEHRIESKEKHDELKDAIVKLGVKIDESKFKWSSIINKDVVKLIVYAIVALTVGGGAASALLQ